MEKYMVNKEIGSGSFGKVFLIEAKSTGIQYVAKQIDLSKLNQRQKILAEKETQVLSKLKHPNIVRYKEAYADEKNLHIVMELCEMGDLHELITATKMRNDRFTDAVVMVYFVQICLALEYIHQQKILHRDLKTKNIFLKKGNVVKLGDFGVAKVLENSFELSQTCIGSPFFISPEMCENKPYDRKSDVWALGCVLYEMVTLKYAFTAKNMKCLMSKIIRADHNPIPDNTNPKIRSLIRKLLNQNPKQRPIVAEILEMPFVVEFKKKIPCRRLNYFAHFRSRSGDDLILQNNLRAKPNKLGLSISKSSVNLNYKEITEPGAKYSSKLPIMNRLWSAKKSPKVTNEAKNLNEVQRMKKLPKVDSQYYNLIQQQSSNCASGRSNKNYDLLNNQEEVEEMESSPRRKRWDTNTVEKNQLISLLNEAELINTFQDMAVKMEPTGRSVEDLLFMKTADLSHLAVLTPIKVQHATTFDNLEQRRSNLEQELGLKDFVNTYRVLEKMLANVEENCTYNISEPLREIARDLQVDYGVIERVWQLVQDDSLFEQ